MSAPIQTINYFKQSSDKNKILALTAWESEIRTDYSSSKNYREEGLSNKISIKGSGYLTTFRQFQDIVFPPNNLFNKLDSTPLPIAVRALSKNQYVIERPPFKTTVRLTPKRAARVQKESPIICEVWIPWTLSFLTMVNPDTQMPSMEIYYNDGPISSLNDSIIGAWTPNIFGHNGVCWGQTGANWFEDVRNKVVDPTDVGQVYHYLINDYYGGGWNTDLGYGTVYNIATAGIGKFTIDPLSNPEIAQRAQQQKIKLKPHARSLRDASVIKNIYNTWGLLTLDEVLEAVSIAKKNRIDHHKITVSSVFERNNEQVQIDEADTIKRVIAKMQPLTSAVIDWSIEINFPKEFIYPMILADSEISSRVLTSTQYGISSFCYKITTSIFHENEELFISYINKTLESIASDVLENSKYSIAITSSIEEIINIPSFQESTLI